MEAFKQFGQGIGCVAVACVLAAMLSLALHFGFNGRKNTPAISWRCPGTESIYERHDAFIESLNPHDRALALFGMGGGY